MRKNSKNKSFYDSIYFDLLDAMKEESCPICFLIQRSESQYLDNLFYELVSDPGVREKLRKSYGFCGKHAKLAKRTGNPLGIAIIYEDISLTLREKIEKEKEIPLPGEGCIICKLVAEVEERYIQSFLKNFSKKNFQNLFRKSFGLCIHHFFYIHSRLSTQEEKRVLKEYELQKLDEYISQLREFIRKHDYRYSHEGFGREATCWKKIVDKIVGNYLS